MELENNEKKKNGTDGEKKLILINSVKEFQCLLLEWFISSPTTWFIYFNRIIYISKHVISDIHMNTTKHEQETLKAALLNVPFNGSSQNWIHSRWSEYSATYERG